VLDGNDTPPEHKGGYPSHIDDTQIAWLERELAAATTPVFIFSHQSLERPNCIRSQEKVRALLEAAKHPDGTRKVAATAGTVDGQDAAAARDLLGGCPEAAPVPDRRQGVDLHQAQLSGGAG
jgi:hypothetical protein